MTDALNYLLNARPEAMGSYFKFMKSAGESLDPRTRALISVITKVAAQTEPGLRQYLSRALQAGVTPNQVLDGLLMAFPMLGLSKIVWAVDVILAMDIPEFRPDALNATAAWRDLGDIDDFPVEGTKKIASVDRELFVYRTLDSTRIYDSRCPHQVTNIPALAIDGHCLTCPKHGWQFDLPTGRCTSGGDRPLREFPGKVEDGRLFVFW